MEKKQSPTNMNILFSSQQSWSKKQLVLNGHRHDKKRGVGKQAGAKKDDDGASKAPN